jgi:uncharacterized protein
MIIRVSELEGEGLLVADPAQFPAPFADRSWRLETVRLRVFRRGADVLVVGELSAAVPLVCSRCLEEFQVEVHPAVDARYVPRPAVWGHEVELEAEDLDVDFYDDDRLDLATLVETETSLALPMKPLCRPDCRGLCPVCGANRNLAPCACERRAPDPRLAALRDWAARRDRGTP